MAPGPISSVIRKYTAVVFFPSFTVATIFADWSHTQRWKRAQQHVKAKREELA